MKNQNQILEPIRQTVPILPRNLVDIFENIESVEEELSEVDAFEDVVEDDDDDDDTPLS